MRIAATALLLLGACTAAAQPARGYDLYIFQPRGGGAEIYAFSGGENAAALEVRGCGDVRVLANAGAVALQLRARRSAPDTNVVTIVARGSRTYLGPCGAEDHDDEPAGVDDDDNLVVIEGANARQMRGMIQSLDAAPRGMRRQVIATLGLN